MKLLNIHQVNHNENITMYEICYLNPLNKYENTSVIIDVWKNVRTQIPTHPIQSDFLDLFKDEKYINEIIGLIKYE